MDKDYMYYEKYLKYKQKYEKIMAEIQHLQSTEKIDKKLIKN